MSKSHKPRKSAAELPVPQSRWSTAAARFTPFWKRHGWRLLLLWTLVLAAYSNSFQARLLFDNVPVILGDARIREATPHNIGMILTQGYWPSSPNSGLYRPLTTLSYLFNYAVLGDGEKPDGYHQINFALHGLNVSLVYALGILVFSEPGLALALAALWGLHPLLTESVTNVVGRADLLAGLGVLAGLLCYARVLASQRRKKAAWLIALACAQTVALFSKESGIVLVGLIVLYDLVWPQRAQWSTRAIAYAALAAPIAAFFLLRSQVQTRLLVDFYENPLIRADFWTARLTAFKVIGKFLGLFLWPARLAADYSYNAIPLSSWQDLEAWISLAACLGAVVLALLWRRKRKALVFFIGFFFVALAPTSNLLILIGSIMAERFLYLPAIGLAGCAVVAIHALARLLSRDRRGSARAVWIAASLACLLLCVRTYARNADWRDELSLWSSTVQVNPSAARPHMNLGLALTVIPNRLPDAIAEYETALRIRPDYAEAHYDLGRALAQQSGRAPDAIREFEAAIRIQPDYAQAHYNLGTVLARDPARMSDAIAEWQAAIRAQPDLAEAHNNLANQLAKMPGRMPDAIAEWQAAVRGNPDLAEAHYNLGNSLSQLPGRQMEAIAEWQAALRAQPNLAEAHNNLANALAQIPGRLPDAILEWQAALRIQPNLVEAHYNLGKALSQTPGRLPDAIAQYEAALRLRPDPELRQLVERLRASQQ